MHLIHAGKVCFLIPSNAPARSNLQRFCELLACMPLLTVSFEPENFTVSIKHGALCQFFLDCPFSYYLLSPISGLILFYKIHRLNDIRDVSFGLMSLLINSRIVAKCSDKCVLIIAPAVLLWIYVRSSCLLNECFDFEPYPSGKWKLQHVLVHLSFSSLSISCGAWND